MEDAFRDLVLMGGRFYIRGSIVYHLFPSIVLSFQYVFNCTIYMIR